MAHSGIVAPANLVQLPAMPAGLSPAIGEAVRVYLGATRAEYDAAYCGETPRAEAAARFATLPALNAADVAAKLIVGVHEISPSYDLACNALLISDDDFPTKQSFEIITSLVSEASALAGDADAELLALGSRCRQLLAQLFVLDDSDDGQTIYNKLEPIEQCICDLPARTPRGAVEKLLLAIAHSEAPDWVERAIAAERFDELVERKCELDFDQRLIVEAIIALGFPGQAPSGAAPAQWPGLVSNALSAHQAACQAVDDDEIDRASDVEHEAAQAVAAVPARSLPMLAEKITVLARCYGRDLGSGEQAATIIDDATRLSAAVSA